MVVAGFLRSEWVLQDADVLGLPCRLFGWLEVLYKVISWIFRKETTNQIMLSQHFAVLFHRAHFCIFYVDDILWDIIWQPVAVVRAPFWAVCSLVCNIWHSWKDFTEMAQFSTARSMASYVVVIVSLFFSPCTSC